MLKFKGHHLRIITKGCIIWIIFLEKSILAIADHKSFPQTYADFVFSSSENGRMKQSQVMTSLHPPKNQSSSHICDIFC